MKPEPTDQEEQTRSRSICEQCWLGPLCLAFWVIIILACIHGCVRGAECRIAWNASTGATDYRVWRGIECLATVTDTHAVLTLPDEPVTLTVTARNSAGESAHSAPLPLVAVTVQESTDLMAWGAVRTIYREKQAIRFYRLKIETP